MTITPQLQIIAALAIITLIGLAVWAYRSAQKAQAQGYDLGYDDAKRGHELRLNALQEEAASLALAVANQHTAHRLERDAIIQDADARIAIYARSANPFNEQDRITLQAAANQLDVAANTYSGLQAGDQVRFARQMQQRLLALVGRLDATLQASDGNVTDSDLIEWLDQQATYWADNNECGELRFPIDSKVEGYNHIREILRDAVAQHVKAAA